jgi:hypothetical protein
VNVLLQIAQNKKPAPIGLERARGVKKRGGVLAELACNVVAAAATKWLNVCNAHVSLRRYITGKLNQTFR